MYRSCGPNNNVCHNAHEFPNMNNLGSMAENIGKPCNEKRGDPSTVHDLCERVGDRLGLGGVQDEIGGFEPADAPAASPPRTWKVHLRDPVAMVPDGAGLEITRSLDGAGDVTLYALTDYGATATLDPGGADGRTLVLALPAAPADPTKGDPGADGARLLMKAGVPADPASIHLGDPNRNGLFGHDLGGALIRPGDPAKSYLMARLTDPEAGPLMPRANCGSWSKSSLRALRCWIHGLDASATNALGPIDYASCPEVVDDHLRYPEPGPACAGSGLCPVESVTQVTDDPTWSNVYKHILVTSCGGSGCHVDSAAGGLDLRSEDAAFTSVSKRVVPGHPEESKLYHRISPELCMAPDCRTMPLGLAPLGEHARGVVKAWIAAGATRD